MEEIVKWLRELVKIKGFNLIEPEMIWYNSSYSTSIEIDDDDNLIIGRPIEDIYTVFKLEEDKITKEVIQEEISYYMNYYINKNWKR